MSAKTEQLKENYKGSKNNPLIVKSQLKEKYVIENIVVDQTIRKT